MKKTITILLVLIMIVLTSCGCEHEWEEATCETPKTCKKCNATDGEKLGHDWKAPTCTTAKVCTKCGKVEGEPLGHITPNLSCENKDVCTRCGETIDALGHKWKEATCETPKTCERCGAIEGEALGHEPTDPVEKTIIEATCTEGGTVAEIVYCSRCNSELSKKEKTTAALGHTVAFGVCERCKSEIYEPIKGNGDDVVTNITLGDGIYRAHVTYTGRSNFVIWLYDKNDDRDLLVNEIGSYDGYVYLNGESPLTFEISSSGPWKIEIESLPKTSEYNFSGNGDYVTDIFTTSSGVYEITNSGKSNFVVWIYTTSGRDLLVNEIGSYTGKKKVSIPSDSNAFFEINSSGSWTIKKVE